MKIKKYKIKLPLPYRGPNNYLTEEQIKGAISICKFYKIPLNNNNILSAYMSFML